MIEINDIKYNIKNWSLLTIQDAEKLSALDLPEKMRDLYTAGNKKDFEEVQKTFTTEDEMNFGEYAGDVLRIVSDIPEELIKYMQYFDRNDLYEAYCRELIMDLVSTVLSYKPRPIESVEFKGEVFFLPKTLKIFDKFLPGHSEKSLTFVEGQALFKAYAETQEKGNLRMLIAIYCRMESEKYDENVAIARSEQFGELPMSVAWEVFFCISELLNTSVKTINTSYQEKLEKVSTLQS